jgi:hypothetical protein
MKKNIYLILILILTFSCKENKAEKTPFELKSETKKLSKIDKQITEMEERKTIFDFTFRKFTELEYFKDFEKYSGTVINYESSKWEYAFQVIQKGNQRMILFEKIIETGKPNKDFKILDTIVINDLKENEFISIGLCRKNGKFDSRIFTIIENDINNNEVEFFKKIKKAWKANLDTKKIEKLNKISGIECTNEGYGI